MSDNMLNRNHNLTPLALWSVRFCFFFFLVWFRLCRRRRPPGKSFRFVYNKRQKSNGQLWQLQPFAYRRMRKFRRKWFFTTKNGVLCTFIEIQSEVRRILAQFTTGGYSMTFVAKANNNYTLPSSCTGCMMIVIVRRSGERKQEIMNQRKTHKIVWISFCWFFFWSRTQTRERFWFLDDLFLLRFACKHRSPTSCRLIALSMDFLIILLSHWVASKN